MCVPLRSTMETIALQQQQHPHRHIQPENWLYEIKQKGQDRTNTCYVMVQNARVRAKVTREEKEVETCARILFI